MRTGFLLAASLGAVAATLAGAAQAQDSAAAATTGVDADAPADQLKDIIVTAQKRVQDAQRTPLSIGVIEGEALAARGQNTLDTALRDVASVEIQGLAQGAQLYIRGVGSSIDPGFADPSIALMVDGAYNGRTESVSSGAYDIDRVEVLRGPQGTLYGRNASGGLVNVVTANPSTTGFSGFVRGQVGNYDLRRLEGAINAPLSDDAAIRIAGYREKRDGYVDDGSYDSNSWGVRGKLLLTPTDWLRIVAKVDIYRERGNGANTVPVAGSAGNLFFPPPYFLSNFDPTIANGPPFTGGAPILRFPNGWVQRDPGDPWSNNAEHVPGRIRREAETYSAQIDADLGPATLTLLPTHTRSDNLLESSFLFGSILPFAGQTYTINSNYTSQSGETKYKSIEARVASNGRGPLTYLFGFYYLGTTPGTPLEPTVSFTNTGQPLVFDTDYLPGSTVAVFGQGSYALTSRLRATAGLRVSRDKSAQNYSVAVGTAAAAVVGFSTSQTSTTYKLGAEYDLAPRSLLYAHVSTGFKQGGISPTIPAIAFDPEKLTAFEIGVKNRLFGNRVQLNAAAFHYRYDGYQFSSFQALRVGSADATGNFAVIQNAGDTSITGAEIEADAVLWRNARVTGSVTYLDATYGSAVLPNNPFVNQGDFDLAGRRIQNSPRWSGNIGFEQGFALAGGMVTAGAHSHLSTGFYVTPEQYLPGAYQKGFTRTDLTLSYTAAGARWSVSGWLRNAENKAQTTYVFPAYRRLVTAPRTIGVTVGTTF